MVLQILCVEGFATGFKRSRNDETVIKLKSVVLSDPQGQLVVSRKTSARIGFFAVELVTGR